MVIAKEFVCLPKGTFFIRSDNDQLLVLLVKKSKGAIPVGTAYVNVYALDRQLFLYKNPLSEPIVHHMPMCTGVLSDAVLYKDRIVWPDDVHPMDYMLSVTRLRVSDFKAFTSVFTNHPVSLSAIIVQTES